MSTHTTFAAMTAEQRHRWLAWARRHDWGGDRSPRFVDHQVIGVSMETSCGFFDSDEVEIAWHRTPAELRAWAGY